MPPRSSASCFGKFILGLLLGLLIIPAAGLLYFRYGKVPVATADKPFPMEKQLVSVPLDARIGREAPKDAPFAASEDVFEGGATLYRQHCAACHGTPGHSIAFAKYMYPHSPQLWTSHRAGVTGVSDDPVGETYWKVSNGIRLTGMPAFSAVLTPAEMWQISILLKNADQPLPDPVTKILTAK
jgi:mono/diheme cytochrome c family protein